MSLAVPYSTVAPVQVGASRRAATVTAYDLVIGLALASVLLQFGKFGVLPVTLQTVIGGLLFVVTPNIVINTTLRMIRQRFMLVFFLLFILLNFHADLRFGIRFGLAASVGRCVSTIALMASFIYYCASHPSRPNRFLCFVLINLGVAQLWYLGELIVPDVLVPIRTWLYYDQYVLEAFENNVAVSTLTTGTRTGLSPQLHLLGYLSCAALGYCLTLVSGSRAGDRELRNWGVFLLLFITIPTVALNMQRSAALGGICGAALLLASPFKGRFVAKGPLVGLAVVLVLVVVVPQLYKATDVQLDYQDVTEKFRTADDYRFRIRMQLEAIKLIAQAPFGLEAHGISWDETGLQAAADATGSKATKKLAVHNGYLNIAMSYGWIGVFMIVWFLWSVGRAIAVCVTHPPVVQGLRPERVVAIAAACFGLLFIQAFFHNSSIFKREPASLVFTCLLAFCMSTRVSLRRSMHPHREAVERMGLGGRDTVNA